jgi:hypothetical protein
VNLNESLKYSPSKQLLKKNAIVICISIFINHFNDEDHFPFNDAYEFPLYPILISIVLGSVTLLVVDYNFQWFQKTYSYKEITYKRVLLFFSITLLPLLVLYIPAYFLVNKIVDDSNSAFDFITGILISIVLIIVLIVAFYANDFYKFYIVNKLDKTVEVKNGTKITLVSYDEIAYFYSNLKIVYLVLTTNKVLPTDFSLNQIEGKFNSSFYFRLNRQTFAHYQAIQTYKLIENSKILVHLKPNGNGDVSEVIISRHKKQLFLLWFQKNL